MFRQPLRHTGDECNFALAQETPDGNLRRVLVGCTRASGIERRWRRLTRVRERPFSWFNRRSGETPFTYGLTTTLKGSRALAKLRLC